VDLSAPIVDGVVHAAYDSPRPEILRLVPAGAHRVLDLGCATGAVCASLVERGVDVTGVESDPDLAALARRRLSRVIEADLESLGSGVAGADPAKLDPLSGPFDCIIAADVLEHLRDPWSVVDWVSQRLAPAGTFIVSVPNVRHLETFWSLAVRAEWPYRPIGIFDRTHLRFFARSNLAGLIERSGLRIQSVGCNYLLSLNPNSKWNRFARYLGDLGTLQFLVTAKPSAESGSQLA
jgi:2-polyprenyl-3-methyl-5-hydroxy-6-metoxy-1,4-benzoquinol methylase